MRNENESDMVAEIKSTELSRIIEEKWAKSLTRWKHEEFLQEDPRELQNLRLAYREAFIEGRLSVHMETVK